MRIILLLGAMLAWSGAFGQSVFVCTNATAGSPGSCQWPNQWTLKAVAAVSDSDKLLRCASGGTGNRDVYNCPGASWQSKSLVPDTDLVAICTNVAPGNSPQPCDIASGGGEGFQIKSVLFPSGPAPTAPTVSLVASPSTIANGAASTLTWSSTDATSCSATGSWSGSKSLSGSQSTGALTVTNTYTLTCSGAGGTASASATVDVAGAPTVEEFTRLIIDNGPMNNPWSKTMGDMNGDGKLDLVVAGQSGPVIYFEWPNWTKRTVADVASTDSGICVGDLTGDGLNDVLAGATWYANPSWVATSIPVPGNHDCVIADLNNDGRNDIVVRAELDHSVFVLIQQPGGSFNLTTLNPGVGLNGLAVASLRNNGFLDIIVGGRWAEQQGCNTNNWVWHDFGVWSDYAFVRTADMDGDGALDIVLSSSEVTGKLSWFKQPTNIYSSNWTETVIAPSLDNVHGFGIADFDGDGDKDVFASEYGGSSAGSGSSVGVGRQLLFKKNGNGYTEVELGRDFLHGLTCGDIDGDGDSDCFGANPWGVTPIVLYRN